MVFYSDESFTDNDGANCSMFVTRAGSSPNHNEGRFEQGLFESSLLHYFFDGFPSRCIARVKIAPPRPCMRMTKWNNWPNSNLEMLTHRAANARFSPPAQ